MEKKWKKIGEREEMKRKNKTLKEKRKEKRKKTKMSKNTSFRLNKKNGKRTPGKSILSQENTRNKQLEK